MQSSNILHSPRNAIPYRLPAALTSTMLTLYPWDTKNDHLYAASDLSAPSYPEFEFLSPSLLAKMYFTAFVLSALPLLVDASLSQRDGLSIPLSKYSVSRNADGVVDGAKLHAHLQRTVAFV